METVEINIRSLVESIYTGHDLLSGYSDPRRAAEGTAWHMAMHECRENDYQSEVAIEYSYCREDLVLHLTGRMDGLTKSEGVVCVEEVKATHRAYESVTQGETVHWAQARAYAAIYCAQHELDEICVRLVYVCLPTQRLRTLEEILSAAELCVWLENLCAAFASRCAKKLARRQKAAESLREMAFPYAKMRQAQDIMCEALTEAAYTRGALMAQAPTGTGKTAAALFPALKAVGEGRLERVFYLTARTTVRYVAAEFIRTLTAGGTCVRAVICASKDSLCLESEAPACHPAWCPYASGFWDRVEEAMASLPPFGVIDREDITACAKRFRVCPHELMLMLCEEAEAVVCDYSNAFDRRAKYQRFFAVGGEYMLLIDEAHNLPDRARDMFSGNVSYTRVSELVQRLGVGREHTSAEEALLYDLRALARRLFEIGEDMRRRCVADEKLSEPDTELYECADSAVQSFYEVLSIENTIKFGKALYDVFYEVRDMVLLCAELNESSAFCMRVCEDDVISEVRCIDPGAKLCEVYEKVASIAMFSATLSPMWYYKRLLGADAFAELELPSPFDPANRLAAIVPVDCEYRMREHGIASVVNALGIMCDARRGNYMAFFPSYAYMHDVYTAFTAQRGDIEVQIQTSAMPQEERQEFLARHMDGGGILTFALMGGVFGEGIDLRGERLIGVAVVSVSLPQICFERELISEYHEALCEDGFEYAYRVPGMNKVLQAAGRLIRTQEDRGVVLLMDKRFTQEEYSVLLRGAYGDSKMTRSPRELKRELAAFWR